MVVYMVAIFTKGCIYRNVSNLYKLLLYDCPAGSFKETTTKGVVNTMLKIFKIREKMYDDKNNYAQ